MSKTTTTTTTTIKANNNIIIAYLLWFFLPGTGIHRMYAGKFKTGILMLALSIISLLLFITVIGIILAIPLGIAISIWWAIDAILMLNWKLGTETSITKTVEVSNNKQSEPIDVTPKPYSEYTTKN